MTSNFHAAFAEAEQCRSGKQRSRSRLTLMSPQQASINAGEHPLINFSSNDYLGLANHPALVQTAMAAAQEWGAGSGASHLVVGHLGPHAELELKLADFVGAERALLFSCGYMANLAIGTTLVENQDLVLHDKLNHASLIDGARLGTARFKRYAHSNLEHAASILSRETYRRCLIVTDGVFSMDGDRADLIALKRLADEYDGLLVVDDAHGFGVLGPGGAGSLSASGLTLSGNTLLMGTLGKALGSFGAFIAGDSVLIEQLMQTARSYIYTTAIPPAVAATSNTALHVLAQEGPSLRQELGGRINQFRAAMRECPLTLAESDTAIQPVIVGADELALQLSDELESRGYLVRAIRPPTVPVGTARLRVTLSAAHTSEQIGELAQAFTEICA